MVTWLMVAAEAREFEGILKRAGEVRPLQWPGAAFSREAAWKNSRWLLIANGPGPRLVERALDGSRQADVESDVVVSIGFCGALDPALRIGDIVVSGEVPKGLGASFVQGDVVSVDRVAFTAREKRDLRAATGAAVVEMESAAVAAKGAGVGCARLAASAWYPTPRGKICRWISIGIGMRMGVSSERALRWQPWGVHSRCCRA